MNTTIESALRLPRSMSTLTILTGSIFAAPAWAQHQHTPTPTQPTNDAKAPTTQHPQEAAVYFCPMKCEGDKTYDKPGACPVCGMMLIARSPQGFTVDFTTPADIPPGKPIDLAITLKDSARKPVKDVDTVHEKPLHLLVVSKDLSYFAHEHPTRKPDGGFALSFTFPAPGVYTLYHDFTPKGSPQQVVPVEVRVTGTAPAPIALTPDISGPKMIDGYTVTLDSNGPLRTGESHLSYTLTKDGKPVRDLSPYLGAMGHLVIISEDLRQFVHAHPHDGADHGSAPTSDARGPKVDFEAHFTAPGRYKSWAQFQHLGKIITIPFTFEVAAASNDAQKDAGHTDPHAGHGGHNK